MKNAWERLRNLLRKAIEERASPREKALSIALGVLIGCTPLLGLHLVISVPIATALKLNRALAALGTNVSFGPIMAVMVWAEIEIGARLLGRPLPPLSADNALEVARGALGAWWLGAGVVAPAVAGLVGLAVYALARRSERKAQGEAG